MNIGDLIMIGGTLWKTPMACGNDSIITCDGLGILLNNKPTLGYLDKKHYCVCVGGHIGWIETCVIEMC